MRHQTLFAALLLAGVSAFGQVTTTAIHTSTTNLPPVGLAPSETLQVNLVNTIVVPTATPPPSCTGSVSFYNSSGTLIGSAKPFTLSGGQIFSVPLPYSSVGAGGSRTEVRAEISVNNILPPTPTGALPPVSAGCFLAISLESYDAATGVTHVFYSGGVAQILPAVIRTGTFSSSVPSPPQP
jgi:hypothetical protein